MSETKRTIAVLYALALSTCFLPLLHVYPPALGKSEWSALDIFRLLASGPNHQWIGESRIFFLAVGYALLAGGLLFLPLLRSAKAILLWTIAVLCPILRLLTTNNNHYTISRILKGQAGWHGDTIALSPEAYVLPALLISVLLVLSLELKNQPTTS